MMHQVQLRHLLVLPLIMAVPVVAQPMTGWGNDRYGQQEHWNTRAEPDRRIEVETFRAADAGALLGKGRVVVSASDGESADSDMDPKLPVYEAAVIDQLVRQGYDTANASDPSQLVQVSVSHHTVMPEEAPRKPVSGAMSTTVSNRGSGIGMALAFDFSKPRKAIVATRMDVRIREKASGRVLWEGHAQGQSREDDSGLDNGAVATRLAAALFARFPEGQTVSAIEGAPAYPPGMDSNP